MERSQIPLNKWMMGFYLMNASKKGVSAHQLHRALGVDYKSAWFMCHRIREAMRDGGLGPLGSSGGKRQLSKPMKPISARRRSPSVSPQRRGRPVTKSGRSGPANKRAIVALVERGGNLRSFHVAVADKDTVNKIVAREYRQRGAAVYR